MSNQSTTPPADMAPLLLHTAVPPATNHPYREHPSPASTASHLAGRHHIDPGGANAQVFAGPQQLHRFAHKPTQECVLLTELVTPFVEQILDLLQPLATELPLIVLAEVALFTQLLDAPICWPAVEQRRTSSPTTAEPTAMSPTDTTTASTGTPRTQQATPAQVRTVICYLRTANPGTVGQRHLQRQHVKLHAACAVHGWTVLEWIEDLHQSGTTMARPGLQHALALLADHHADALLATEQRSLAVDATIGSQLAALAHRQGWQLLTLASSAAFASVVDDHQGLGRGHGGARR